MSVEFASEAERLRAALATIPAHDYTTWVDMAFAVKQGLGDAGFDLWDAWSQTAPNYDARSARATWRSARESGPITLASLFWLAREHGFDLAGSRVFGNRPGRLVTKPFPVADSDGARTHKRQARRAAVAREAQAIWRWSRPLSPDHPYRTRKHIPAIPTLRELETQELRVLLGYAPKSRGEPLWGRVLIVPVSIGHQMTTLELIDCEGRKSALAGGAKAGGWWSVAPTRDPDCVLSPIAIAEGVATAVSVWQATGWYTLAALSSGNLANVAAAWRARYPQRELVVLADLDAGYAHAERAARDTQARLITPAFRPGAHISGKTPTDFNDMAVLDGVDAVAECLRRAVVGIPTRVLIDTRVSEAGAQCVPLHVVGGEGMGRAKADKGTVANDFGRRSGKGRSGSDDVATRAPESREAVGRVHRPASTAGPSAETSAVGSGSVDGPGHSPGEPLYRLDTVPAEVKALAQHRFGAALRMATPRAHGGPYRGEVFNTEHYLVQEVAPRSVVFHAKAQMTFVSDRLRWMDENHRLNGADVQIGYDGERAKVYPWDRTRDQLERAVASLKRSAREIGLNDDMDAKLDALQAASWARVKAARVVALAHAMPRAKDRGEPDDPQR